MVLSHSSRSSFERVLGRGNHLFCAPAGGNLAVMKVSSAPPGIEGLRPSRPELQPGLSAGGLYGPFGYSDCELSRVNLSWAG